MAEKIYPERQRCKTCKKGFKELVLEGLYCSYRCGRFANPSASIDLAPRSCKRQVNGTWGYKTRYKSQQEVPEKFKNDPSTNIYICENCHMYHIGHSRIPSPQEEERLVRYVNSYKEIGSVIQRYRESKNIDKKLLAKKIGIPIIRITEVENSSPKVTAQMLFIVLDALKLRIEISGPPIKK